MSRRKRESIFNSATIKYFSAGEYEPMNGTKTAYHYTSPEAFLSIIQSKSLRFTDIRYMNDRSEGVYFVKLLLDFIDDNKGKFPLFEEIVNELLKDNKRNEIKSLHVTEIKYRDVPNLKYRQSRIFLFCTCLKPDLLNMWNYYVNNSAYQGYSIGFYIDELLKVFDTESPNVLGSHGVIYGPVLYKKAQHDREIETLAAEIEKIAGSGEKPECGYAQIELRRYIDLYGAFFKNPKFEAENEFRIAIEIAPERVPHKLGEHGTVMEEGFCTKRGLIVPYLKVRIPEKSIFRVNMAPMTEVGIARASLHELLDFYGIDGVSVYASEIPIRF